MIKIKKGLDIPISGQPLAVVEKGRTVRSVGVTGLDFVGMKPTMLVKEGDFVQTGQALFLCKKNEGLHFTSPASGKIVGINRGERRAFESMEIALGEESPLAFKAYLEKAPEAYKEDEIRRLLAESGMWTAFRQRPFDKTPPLKGECHSIFISILDTNPLAMDPQIVISERSEFFHAGLKILSLLPQNYVYLCTGKNNLTIPELPKLKVTEFSGLHPAGNVGTHIHFLQPVSSKRNVWHIGYQDVIAVGYLFMTGQLDTERWVAIGGPRATSPRILKTRLGANLEDFLVDEVLKPESTRVISGSILNGRKREGALKFLGRFHNQIVCIEEDNKREFLGWHSPGFNRFSQKRIYFSRLWPSAKFALGSSTHGSPRAMVPTGSFEEITSLDILPTQLLRSLLSYDTDTAQELGCLDLAEEDLALYTFVSPGKIDFGPVLRENLTKIEKEG